MLGKTATWAILLALLPLPTLAAVTFTNSDYYIQAGLPFTIAWANNRGAVTITLMNGPDVDLQSVLVIVSDYEGQQFTWTPQLSLPADSYELQIEDSGSVDYSPRFQLEGADASPTISESKVSIAGRPPQQHLTLTTHSPPPSQLPPPHHL